MKQYLNLLLTREAKEIIGKNGTNLWLLTLVLVATFVSIAFSEGSMIYLKEKMEDPFTNWVSIAKSGDDKKFCEFRDSLFLDENKEKYDYRDVLMDQYTNYNIMGKDKIIYPSVRFFEHIKTPLVDAILSKDNVIDGCKVDSTLLIDNTMGFIVTMDVAEHLGYNEENLPSYISYLAVNEGADSLGLKLEMDNQFYPVAVPVLAVVRRLPNNVDMMSANFFYEQQHVNSDVTYPFDFKLHESEYLHQLTFYVSDKITEKEIEDIVKENLPDTLKGKVHIFNVSDDYLELKSWKPGSILKIDLGDERLPRSIFQGVADAIEKHFDIEEVRRVHKLIYGYNRAERGSFLSIEFRTLKYIREFEAYAKLKGIDLEMEQVHSKENFNAVTVMASILSAAMVIFSIVCIIMFMINMLQSYFQKIQRNIGTFKAFGMNGIELTQVYVLLLVMIVCTSVVLALLITWGLQGLLPIMGIEKNGFNYLSLWNTTTYIAIGIVVISTIFTVSFVMSRMLNKTPGDLIYDRD